VPDPVEKFRKLTGKRRRRRRDKPSRPPVPPREWALAALLLLNILWLSFALGGVRLWGELTALALALASLFLLPRWSNGEIPGAPRPVLQLLKLPLFWLGLGLYGFFAIQAWNLAWDWTTAPDGRPKLVSQTPPVSWLPSGLESPLDESNPETIFTLNSYLNREQYGDRPLFHGHYFNAEYIDRKEGGAQYYQAEDRYEIMGRKQIPIYDPKMSGLFPRMYSNQSHHVEEYKSITGAKGGNVKPTMGQNLAFLFKYQIGHMYMRYFMWNFAGRQNDIQGHREINRGNWLSGINFIDEFGGRLGPQDDLPVSMTSNKAYNRFYMVPLILGLIGLFFQYYRDRQNFWLVFLMFFMTGLAIVLYLNQYPYQPRERDYAYAGSFYAFAFWIGFAVLAA